MEGGVGEATPCVVGFTSLAENEDGPKNTRHIFLEYPYKQELCSCATHAMHGYYRGGVQYVVQNTRKVLTKRYGCAIVRI